MRLRKPFSSNGAHPARAHRSVSDGVFSVPVYLPAFALGYSNPNKAINDHCRAITKCSTPISGKVQEIRTLEENGKVLFCGSDVAKALGYAIPTKAVNTHCKGVSKMEAPTTSGVQTMLFISEGDVYRLITHSKTFSEVFRKKRDIGKISL